MIIQNAIEYALEGEALLFLGAGFSSGALNLADENFPLGNALCERLIEDGKIDTSSDSVDDLKYLDYVSERYVETNTKQDLLKFLKAQFTCKRYTDAQKTIAQVPWKRIYTTNYDNIFERISSEIGLDREVIDPDKNSSDVLRYKNAIVHVNGYVGNVNEEKLENTFKLLTRSYQARTIPDSDWAISLHNDIQNAKCIIFIGYSLDYDLELQQIFAENAVIKQKCLFITWKPSRRAYTKMERFGTVETIGVDCFAKNLEIATTTFTLNRREYKMQCLHQIDCDEIVPAEIINDRDVADLFFKGEIRMENIFSINRSKYIVSRDYCSEIEQQITGKYRAVIIHSDLGNGKSVLLREMEAILSERGTVFYLDTINSYIQDDLDYICSLRGMKYIFIENYNRIIDSEYVKVIARYQRDDLRFLFTVRSFLNDNLYQRFLERFNIVEDQIAIQDVNTLTSQEINKICKLLDIYSLWGKKSKWNRTDKLKYLRKKCKSEMRSIMLDLLESEYMQKKIHKLLDALFIDKDLKEITLLIFMLEIIAIELKLDDVVLLLNKQVKTPTVIKNKDMCEFFEFDKNRICLKSPLVAFHVLQNNNYNEEITTILKKILPVLDRHREIEPYKNILKMLISYSNLRMLFCKNDSEYNDYFIRIFEMCKTLTHYQENPFFWLQYAIVCMEKKDYKLAEIYLDNAEAFSHKKFEWDSWQINTHKARLLLEKTIAEKNEKEAYSNFDQAVNLLLNNKTPDLHYPLRQVSLFKKYYSVFYKGFSEAEKSGFLFNCITVQNKISEYLSSKAMARAESKKIRDIQRIQRDLEQIRLDILAKEE